MQEPRFCRLIRDAAGRVNDDARFGEGRAATKGKETKMEKYEVQIAVTLHGAVDVRAESETAAEEKAKEMLRAEKLKIADFEIGEDF